MPAEPVRGEAIAPMMPVSASCERGRHALERAQPERRVADHALAPGDGGPARLELRLDQEDQVGAGCRHRAGQRGDDAAQRDEARGRPRPAGTGSKAGSAAASSSTVSVRTLVRSSTVTSRVGPQRGMELPVAHVDRVDVGRAALEQAVGEAAGGGSGIEGAPAGDGDGEAVQCGLELAAAAADVRGRAARAGRRARPGPRGVPPSRPARRRRGRCRRRWPPGPPAGGRRGRGARARRRAGGGPRWSAGGLLGRSCRCLGSTFLPWPTSWCRRPCRPSPSGTSPCRRGGGVTTLAAAPGPGWPSCRPARTHALGGLAGLGRDALGGLAGLLVASLAVLPAWLVTLAACWLPCPPGG